MPPPLTPPSPGPSLAHPSPSDAPDPFSFCSSTPQIFSFPSSLPQISIYPLYSRVFVYLSFSLAPFPRRLPSPPPDVLPLRSGATSARGGEEGRHEEERSETGNEERREKAGDGEVNKGGKGNQKESKNGIRERRMGGRKGKGD